MTFSCSYGAVIVPSGARHSSAFSDTSIWGGLWGELVKSTPLNRILPFSTSLMASIVMDAIPVVDPGALYRSAANMVNDIKKFFGTNVKETAGILNVSRPMFYHYMKGMEPDLENRRRMALLVTLVDENPDKSMKFYLKAQQPEGKTLLDYLSAEQIDVVAVREIIRRATAQDRQMRQEFATSLRVGESIHQKQNIARERHAAGKPVYIASSVPGKLIQVLPDGTRISGRMVKRVFIPDDE